MYGRNQDLRRNMDALFSSLYAKYTTSKPLDAVTSAIVEFNDKIDILVEFAFYLAGREGERTAIDYCDLLREALIDNRMEDHIAPIFLAEAKLFDNIGIGMSRDLFALEAADSFAQQGRFTEAEAALKLVAA